MKQNPARNREMKFIMTEKLSHSSERYIQVNSVCAEEKTFPGTVRAKCSPAYLLPQCRKTVPEDEIPSCIIGKYVVQLLV